MPRPRRTPRSFYATPTVPFLNAEEAWFWFIRCQKARAGARFEATPGANAGLAIPMTYTGRLPGCAANGASTPSF